MRTIRALRTLFLALLVSVVPASSFAGVFVSITVAPPILPVYAQPVCPGMDTSGLLDTGLMAMRATSGFREPGCLHPGLDFFGLLATGVGVAAFTPGTADTGVPTSAFTVG